MRCWLGVSIVVLSTLFVIDPARAFQVRHDKTPFDDRVIVDPVATMDGDAVPLESSAIAASRRAGWDRLGMSAVGGWRVYLDRKSGAPMLVDGAGLPWAAAAAKNGVAPSLEVLESSIRKFFRDNRDILLADDAELSLNRDASVPLAPHVSQIVFDHVVAGVPVLGDKYVFYISQGNLVSFGASRWTPVFASPVPTIPAAEALGRMELHMGLDETVSTKVMVPGELFFIPQEVVGAAGPSYASRLIWRVVLQVEGVMGTWVGLVDATDGTMLGFYDDDKYAQVKGGVLPESTDDICPSGCEQPGYPMPYADLSGGPSGFANANGLFSCSPGGSTATTTLNGQYVRIADVCGAISASVTCDADLDLGGNTGTNCAVPAGASPGDTRAARTGFYHLNRLKEVIRGWLPTNVWNNGQVTENTNVNQTCNANWSGGQINMFRGDSQCRNTGEIAGVVQHEFGHGMDQNDGGGFDNPSEAYADITEFLADRTSCIGRGFFTSGVCSGYGNPCTTCNGIRDMNWAARVNNTPSTPAGFIASCPGGSGPCGKEVHCEGYLAGETIWDLATRDLPAMGLGQHSAWQLTDRLWWQSRNGSGGNAYTCSGGTGNSCGATHWMQRLRIMDDDDGNLANGTPHAAAIFAAFNRHGIACGASGDATNQNSNTCPVLVTPTVTPIASTNSVVLNWTNVPNATGYRVLRSDLSCGTTQVFVASVPAPTTTYTDTGLSNGFDYYYRVQPIGGTNGLCDGPVSACMTATPQPFAGVVTLDKSAYSCSSTIGITVLDGNIGAPTTTVAIRSTTEATPEVVTLTQTPAGSATYVGSITTTGAAPTPNGQLSVANGDTITAEYVDADDGVGGTNVLRSATAGADCVAPIISAVTAVDVTGISARITWATDELSSSTVNYGTTAPPSSTTSAGGLVNAHSVPLTGLTECTPYVYSVQSTDAPGNTVSDNNGGTYYTFTTGKNTNPSYVSTDTPQNIPDNNSTGITSTINVTDDKTVLDVNVTVNITHTYDGDLQISLIAPNGATVPLATNRGGSGDNFVNTVFDDEATATIASGTAPFTGSFKPETPLTAAEGGNAAGAWRLKVVDNAGQDVGPLNSWTLTLLYPAQACGPHAKLGGSTDVADVCSTGGAGGNGRWDAGETVSFSVTIANDGTDPLTGITATVTSPTPGVVISNGTQPIANLAAGASAASGAPHVSALLPSGIACGNDVTFHITINSAQGSWVDSFTHTCGQVVPGNSTPINETFGAGIPATWSIVDGGAGGGAAATWTTANPGARTFTSPLVSPVAVVDSDNAGTASSQDEQMITSVLNLSTATSVTIQWDQYFRWYSLGQNEFADVDVRSANTGGAWVNVARMQGASSPNPEHKTVDITAQAAGAPDVQVRFHYWQAQFEWWWQVDNIKIDAVTPAGCDMVQCPAGPGGVAKPVPDGTYGTAMKADRGVGGSISLTWDVATCSSTDHEVLYGSLATLSTYAISGSYCGLGVSGTSNWAGVPGGNIWFVVVGTSGAGTEASWGSGTAGERGGTSASGQCGNTVRDNGTTCP